MKNCYTTVGTPNSSKYLQQLCKHFRHKVTVEFDETTARVDFPIGLVFMHAVDENLSFYCRADVDGAEEKIRSVLDSHLVKFAWREDLNINWHDGLPDDLPVAGYPALEELKTQ